MLENCNLYIYNRTIYGRKGDILIFLTMGEKVRKLREQLDLKQEDLQSEDDSVGLIISMIETGK